VARLKGGFSILNFRTLEQGHAAPVESTGILQPNATRAGLLALVGALIAFVGFAGALSDLVTRWSQQEEYSHGFLIPVVSIWLLWRKREALRVNIGRPSWLGPIVILFAALLHVVGELSAIFILSQLAFVFVLAGLALAAGGYSLLRVAFVPLFFLLFAIPLPYFVDATLTFRLQLISSELGAFFVRLFHIPVYLDGNIIDLGNYKLLVTEACSGLRYIYPFLSLGFLAAYLFRAPSWQRATVFLSTIPLTIVMNGFRIGVVGVTVNYWGIKAADEFLHFFEGWIVFIACGGVLLIEIYILARMSGKSLFEAFYNFGVTEPSPLAPQIGSASFVPLAVSLVVLCAAGISVFGISGRPELIPDRPRFVEYPERIGAWRGRSALMEPDVERSLIGLNDYILSDYRGADAKDVNLYVAYYASQRKGESPHSPVVCIPGGGWQIVKFERTNYANGDIKLPLNRVTIEKNSTKQIVYYWFNERGRKIANEYLAKWYLLTDAILMNRTDGALVRLTTQVYGDETEHDADMRLQAFIRDAVPTLSDYLPSDTNTRVQSVQSEPNSNRL